MGELKDKFCRGPFAANSALRVFQDVGGGKNAGRTDEKRTYLFAGLYPHRPIPHS